MMMISAIQRLRYDDDYVEYKYRLYDERWEGLGGGGYPYYDDYRYLKKLPIDSEGDFKQYL